MKLSEDILDKFLSLVVSHGGNDCWEWVGCKNREGYGQFNCQGRSYVAHRVSYEHYKGDIPDNLVIHHMCYNKSCVNPNHLEAITNKENLSRKRIVKKITNNTLKLVRDIEDEAWRNAKADAAKHGITLGQWIEEAIQEKIERK